MLTYQQLIRETEMKVRAKKPGRADDAADLDAAIAAAQAVAKDHGGTLIAGFDRNNPIPFAWEIDGVVYHHKAGEP